MTTSHPLRRQPSRLLLGVSVAAMASGLAMPAQGQLARLRSAAGTPVAPVAAAPAIPLRPVTMREAQTRALALQSRADQIRSYVVAARDAALASTRPKPTDGLSANGLDPIAAVREAAALTAAGGADNIAKAQALLASVSSATDSTGRNTWEGAGAPVQSTVDGRVNVSITQTQERALLTWNRFDVGANTTLQFVQKAGGAAQPGWTVVNRVAEAVAPSTILGQVKADGTVLVLNRAGVIFGQGAQINLSSLLASTLEIGNFGRNFRTIQNEQGQNADVFDAITLKERNTEYLQNGLFAGTRTSGTLPSLLFSPLYPEGMNRVDSVPAIEGAVEVDPGASITAASGGFVIMAGPKVINAGAITASNGQVSLQGGRIIAATQSTGAATSVDPDVRGLVLRTIGTVDPVFGSRSNASAALASTPDDGVVINRGVIDSPRGYLSLGAGLFGSVTNDGLLASTTSVSRNGKISLTAGTVTLGGATDQSRASAIVILPDASTETIPQGTADNPAPFKTSAVEIGARADDPNAIGGGMGEFIPNVFSMEQNAILWAPSANVVIGRAGGTAFNPAAGINTLSGIDIANGSVIDVSGMKDVQVSAARNSLEITPVKRNELRDTPNYREVSLTGDFTLNGKTLFVDPRRSGVRADGVRWVGSPLIEAGSLASQIGVTAAELMTKGGNVAMGVNPVTTTSTAAAAAPHINIASGATIDFGGGWVHYDAGIVRTSNLLTADGRIVNIGDADPNDIFVGVADGFTSYQPRFGESETFIDPLLQGGRVEAAYDEGRDAGTLLISGSALTVNGTFFGDAFAGARQLAGATRGSVTADASQDPRLLQRTAQDLPSGGYLRIGSLTGASGVALGGDIGVYAGTTSTVAQDGSVTLLSDAMLSRAGLSALTLQTTGGVSFAEGSSLTLADGATLTVDAGRGIAFDGDVRIAGGAIRARTYEFAGAPIKLKTFTSIGSPFSDDDDILPVYRLGDALPRPYDITVTGRLSTAGRWTNDYASGMMAQGSAWTDGGSISLTVAPKVFVALAPGGSTIRDAGDLSGSITIAPEGALDVSAGGYIAPNRTLRLTARGGAIALINETTYAATSSTITPLADQPGRSDAPIAGANQTVDFTPTDTVVPSLVPSDRQARVTFSADSLRGFGFTQGGSFTLVAPEVGFGSTVTPGGANIPLDFFARTGMSGLDVTTFHSTVVSDIFTNPRKGQSAFFDTTQFVVHAGETLNLTTTLLPRFLDAFQSTALLSLRTGGDIRSILTPSVPTASFDQVAANLTLRGLTEVVVESGGAILGAPGASITTPKLLNAGTIILPGGSITQQTVLPVNLGTRGYGITDLSDVFGAPNAKGQWDENAQNVAGFLDPTTGEALTLRDLFSRPEVERFLYFTGAVAADQGIVLRRDSVTDLSGVALLNPRAGLTPGGQQLVTGRILDGGTISTAALFSPSTTNSAFALFTNPVYGSPRYVNVGETSLPPLIGITPSRSIDFNGGAIVKLAGASALLDQQVGPTAFSRTLQWSNGGTLSIGGGGTFAGALIDAHGGASAATGGTLTWLLPTIRQANTPSRESGVISATQIENAGFATLNALGGVTFDGVPSLSLAKAFTVQSAPSTTGAAIADEAAVVISSTGATKTIVDAPYIRFTSRLGTTPNLGQPVDPADGRLSFIASGGIDFVGGVLFDSSTASVSFTTPGDVRFIGVDDRPANSTDLPSLDGRVIAWGDMLFDAGRIYATTGTGNLQRFIEDQRAGVATTVSPFLVAALGDSKIAFGGTYLNKTSPLSAGSYLKIQAATIEQGGYLAAPLGLLEIGSNSALSLGDQTVSATTKLSFLPGSVTTVSGAGLLIPYGSTTDLTEYFFSPSVGLPITTAPSGQLKLSGVAVDLQEGSTVDGRGGGDVFAFEFVSGTGGSRDVLDRINRDAFSANAFDPVTGTGLQYADGRQVYAIVPADQARSIAAFDPIYSADYLSAAGGDLYGANVGRAITIDGAANGIPAGEYVLLPAHYALLPGAYRVVENAGVAAPTVGTTQTLLDGSIIVGGVYSTAGTSLSESARRSFTIQSKDVFSKFSQLATTSGTAAVVAAAQAAGITAPRNPLDAARVVIAPLRSLAVEGAFDTTPAKGGRGAQFDILGKTIVIAADETVDAPANALVLTDDALTRLGANSLSIGAERSENKDGTTVLGVVAKSIRVADGVSLSAPELLLSVGGNGSTLTVESGATLIASGALDDAATGDYLIPSLDTPPLGYQYDASGIGSVLRVSSGPERLIARAGDTALRNTLKSTELTIADATIRGNAVGLDSTRDVAIATGATIDAKYLALGGDTLRFSGDSFSNPLLRRLGDAENLTLYSRSLIAFGSSVEIAPGDPAVREFRFRNLTLDTPGLALASASPVDVRLVADSITLRNTAAGLPSGTCGTTGALSCGSNTLFLIADQLHFGSGTMKTYGFGAGTSMIGRSGAFVEGKGGFDIGGGLLSIATPFLADRGVVDDPRDQPIRPDYTFATTGAVQLLRPAGPQAALPTTGGTPGARIAFGSADAPVASMTIDAVAVRATAGVIDVRSSGDVTLRNGASLSTPGYTRTFGDAVDSVTVSADGGTISLTSLTGNIGIGPGATLSADNGIGAAGAINLLASNGAITFNDLSTAFGPVGGGARASSLTFDSGASRFDLTGFLARYGTAFGGDIAVRSGVGDLSIGEGQLLRARSVELVAEGGIVSVAGTIDTSGVSVAGLSTADQQVARVNGGDVTLYGATGVTLASTGRIDTHTTGYAANDTRQASGGDVTLGVGQAGGAVTLAAGSTIDVGARRPGDRLVAQVVKDPATLADTTVYRYAAADMGGDVSFRAPVIEADGASLVDIRLHGAITGANEVSVEAYKVWNLDQIATDGLYSGVDAVDGGVSLDLSQTRDSTGKLNILTDDFARRGTQSVVNFIRTFSIQASDGSDLTGMRLRPGIELTSTGNVSLATNWNLGAGILDQKAAIAAGLLVEIPELGKDSAGRPYYAVAPGHEAELIGGYVNMIYRVGGRADGEAAVVTVRARGTLDISHSISDGFFSFGDRTDPGYMSYQLGGGNRTVAPAVIFGCGTRDTNDCSTIKDFDKFAGKGKTPEKEDVVTISLVGPVGGTDLSPGILAPYSAVANSAAALGSGKNGAGDPLGGAELFPLLEDGTRAIRSTTLRLVGGADAKNSANPLHVDRATGASVNVSGETSFQIVAKTGKSQYAGDLQLQLRPSIDSSEFTPVSVAPEDFLDAVANSDNAENIDPNKADGYYTILKWGEAGQLAKTSRERAQAYFAQNFPGAIFQGKPGDETGVAAPLSAILGFLEFYGPEYAQKIVSGEFKTGAPNTPKPINLGRGDTAYVGTTVRSGDGSIHVAAAKDIDLRRTPDVTYRTVLNTGKIPSSLQVDPTLYQVGGNAIYTAGHALARVTRVATAADGTVISFTASADTTPVAFDPLSYQPSNKGLYLNRPQLLEGGGDVSLIAATGDVVGRRDVWAEQALGTGTPYNRESIGKGFEQQFETFLPDGLVGAADQRWRMGQIGQDTEILAAPQLFTSGVGTFGGGDVSVRADGVVNDLTLAVDTTVTTTDPLAPGRAGDASPPVLWTFGGGDASVVAGGDLIGGQIDLGSGVGRIRIGGDVVSAGFITKSIGGEANTNGVNELRLRVADSFVDLRVAGSAQIGGVGSLGVLTVSDQVNQDPGKGYYSALAGVGVTANEGVTLNATRPELAVTNFSNISPTSTGLVLPPSLSIASLSDDIAFGGDVPRLLYPSAVGQLSLLAGGEIQSLALAMSDADPSLLPGAFSVNNAAGTSGLGLDFGFAGVFPNTSDVALRLLHNQRPTHAGDDAPARVYAGGSITSVTLSLAKQARIGAGLDIVDMVFFGQNVRDTDVTRITAGRDIIGTTAFSAAQRRPYISGNTFTLGGYGTLSIEAGRNLGPFLNSATVLTSAGSVESFAGGIRTVGNDLNPWLDNRGANINALFGIAKGADFDALQATYLDPATAAMLDGDLFVQVSDALGNLSPDRSRPIYAPILAQWLRDKAPDAFARIFGTTPPSGDALTTAAFSRMPDLYAAFAALDNLTRRGFLIDQLYFNELAQTAIPTSPSYQQYVRGYRATQTLFPTSLGYTDNLAPYTTDPATITPDHPLGVPTRTVVDGQPVAATRVLTGNVDLRLATIETERGGDITILGPGGDVLAGSVVRTSDQAARRATLFGVQPSAALESGILSRLNQLPISAIPIGFEGVLTLRGGAIRSATDGDFRLNQSRLFTLGGGDINLWSSNGDLNAGQGPRSASSFPPVTVRFDLDGRAEVDSAGSVAGAGIGAFKPTPESPDANIILVAPVGEVDAGDAGVRASGNVFVAAARVANADNFSAGGDISGVPNATVLAGATVPTDAASAVVGAISSLANNAANNTDKLSLISVDVLGFLGDVDDCDGKKVDGVCATR